MDMILLAGPPASKSVQALATLMLARGPHASGTKWRGVALDPLVGAQPVHLLDPAVPVIRQAALNYAFWRFS